jgi:hypothetical protein
VNYKEYQKHQQKVATDDSPYFQCPCERCAHYRAVFADELERERKEG